MKICHLARLGVVSLFMLASACTSTQTGTQKATQPEKQDVKGLNQATQEDQVYLLGEVPGQKLETGQCGIFLFAARPEPRFVFFAEATTGLGKVVLNGEETTLVRTDVSGDVLDLHYTNQTYLDPVRNIEYIMTINATTATEGGHQIDMASLRMNAPGGWKMVIPVGGATSCNNS